MISCKHLNKVYRGKAGEVRSLDGLDLAVKAGEFLCVRGPSGCGKTTLLLTLGAMLRPTNGTVQVNGQEIYDLSLRERSKFRATTVGFVFQMFHLVPYLTVLENVLAAAGGTNSKDARHRAETLLAELGLSSRLRHRPSELSAGERQRTALARALLNQPQLLLADEPTGNLDPQNAAEVFQHLKQFQRSGGTVVVVTHGDTAEGVADRVLEMRNGKFFA